MGLAAIQPLENARPRPAQCPERSTNFNPVIPKLPGPVGATRSLSPLPKIENSGIQCRTLPDGARRFPPDLAGDAKEETFVIWQERGVDLPAGRQPRSLACLPIYLGRHLQFARIVILAGDEPKRA